MIVRRLLWEAGKRLAQNPEVRARATEIATDVADRARPKLESAGRHVSEIWRETTAEIDPRENPREFARRLKQRLLPPDDGD
jgi:hypothetical protein